MDYDEYQNLVVKQRDDNEILLNAFEQHLIETGLSEQTVNNHMRNLDFYVNHFLLYEEIIRPEDGIEEINYFFNNWFPRKAMWSNPSSASATITVLKKFYAYLLSQNMVNDLALKMLTTYIKENKTDWLNLYKPMSSDWDQG